MHYRQWTLLLNFILFFNCFILIVTLPNNFTTLWRKINHMLGLHRSYEDRFSEHVPRTTNNNKS